MQREALSYQTIITALRSSSTLMDERTTDPFCNVIFNLGAG
jgi:hypothetical protein